MKIRVQVFLLLTIVALIALFVGKYVASVDNSSLLLSVGGVLGVVAAIASFWANQSTRSTNQLTQDLQQITAQYNSLEADLGTITIVKERMESELAMGRQIQMNLLTLTFPSFPKRKDLDLYAILKPARELGGDFYDFYFFREETSYFLEENRFFFCVGDVSGKGVPAALFMAVAKSLIKSQASHSLSPAKILTYVNQVISVENPFCMFVTLFLGVLNLTNGELIYTNAGHNPPFIRRQSGELEPLADRHGAAVGVIEDLTYKETRTSLSPGDVLVVYTDGVTEAMDPQHNLFSEERFVDLLQSASYTSAEEVVDLTMEKVYQFQGGAEQADDITVLSLRFLGNPAAKEGELRELGIKSEVLSNLREVWE
jgi:sigma-B regulation protein RsbU (phosphoserine phosphatase)